MRSATFNPSQSTTLKRRLWSLPYLPFYMATWLWSPPDAGDLIISAGGLVLFVAIYLGSAGLRRDRLAAAVAVLAIGLALAPTGSNWPVLSVYAAMMIAEIRPLNHARAVVIMMGALTTLVAALLKQDLFYVVFSGFMVLVGGLEGISRAAFDEANGALKAAQHELRRLGALAERERIARDLHDLLGRTLTLVALKADLAARLAIVDANRAKGEMDHVAVAARAALAEVRSAVSGMTTADLSREIASTRSALSAIDVHCHIDGDPAGISAQSGAVLAMALREAVTNIIRHSRARSCWITIQTDEAGDRLIITDDGVGGELQEGNGIAGMRRRLLDIGGQLDVFPTGSGMRVSASVTREKV